MECTQVLNVAYLIVAGFCTMIGGLGYYMYGHNAADVVIFNLPTGVLATVCCCMVLVNPVVRPPCTPEHPAYDVKGPRRWGYV